jgi:Fibronectin type III domain
MTLSLLPLAASVMLIWDAVPEVALYRVHVGIQSMREGNPPAVSYRVDIPEFEVTGLDYGTNYYFVVTAVSFDGLESEYSNEVQYTPSPGKRRGHDK